MTRLSRVGEIAGGFGSARTWMPGRLSANDGAGRGNWQEFR
jgi:hypothetical protein